MKRLKLIDETNLTLNELAVADSSGTPYVMMLLRKKILNPEDVQEELLPLRNQSDTSVLDVCLERLKEPVSDNEGRIVPRALFLASKPGCKLPLHFRCIKEILEIAKEDGWTVAHECALQRILPKSMMTEEILTLTDNSGCSVAYHTAWLTSFPKWAKRRKDILLLGNGYGDYVVHVLAKQGKLPSEIMTEEILKITNRDRCSVAYHAAAWNFLPDWAKRRKDILLLGNGQGNYVAHVLARRGELPVEMMTEDMLNLKDSDGCTLAYNAAWHDSFPEWAKRNRDILLLGDGQGDYVAHVLVQSGRLLVESMTEEILKLKDRNGCTLAYHAAWYDSFPEWAKKRKDILLLDNGRGNYVVHMLAQQGALPVEMMTEEILRLENKREQTVLAMLVSGRHLSPEILMLPWDENTKVFEYLCSDEFQKQVQDEPDIIYVREQLSTLEALLREKAFAELSVRQNPDHDHRRELER